MALIGALVLAVVLTPVAGAIARRVDLVDHPGPLKVHAVAVPYLGGVALLAAAAPWLALSRPALFAPIGLACVLGVVDDARSLSPKVRLLAEVGIGVLAAWVVDTRGPDVVHVLLVTLAVVVLVNAVNVIDGLDGLAAGVTAAGFGALALVLDGDERVAALAMLGATIGVIAHNRPPARIYLGDGGSYLLGTALAVLAASAWADGRDAAAGIGAGIALLFPVAELTVAVVRRARARQPLLQGDRSHVYDQLVDRGWPATQSTLACVVAAVVLGATGVLAAQLSSVGAVVVGVLAVGALVAIVVAARFVAVPA